MHFIVEVRLRLGRFTVVGATNVQKELRQPLLTPARKYNVLPVANVFGISERICFDRNQQRSDRTIPPYVLRQRVLGKNGCCIKISAKVFGKIT